MPNPKKARIKSTATQTQDTLTVVLQRLRSCGARPDELQAVRETWNETAGERTEQWRHEMLHMSDAALRKALIEIREEYPFEPVVPDEPFDLNPDGMATGAFPLPEDPTDLGEGAPKIGATIPELMEWVAADPARARLVIAAEQADADVRGEPVRKTLMSRLQVVVDAS